MYTVDKVNTITKVKADVKATISEFLVAALREKFGDDSVKMVRTGKSTKTNEICVVVDEVTNEDGTVEKVCVTLNPSVKEFTNRTSEKGKVYIPFDFDAAAQEFDEYLSDKEIKAAEAKAKKAAKAEEKNQKED